MTAETGNVAAITKPYTHTVWILILTAVPIVVTTLYFVSHRRRLNEKTPLAKYQSKRYDASVRAAIDYIVGVICSQGI